MIRAKHPIREEFSECSTGSGENYYPTKGTAIHAYESVLAEYGFRFDPDDCFDLLGDNGHITLNIWSDELECALCVGWAMITWHRMPSGNYEFIGYIR